MSDGDEHEAVVAIDEVAGMARFAGALVDQLTIPIRDTHRAVADRVFRAVGPVATPVRLAHDGISGGVYASVRGGARLAGAAAGTALSLTHRGRDRRIVSAHPLGAQALSFFSGLLGDWVDDRAADLVVRLGLTHHGRPVPLDPALLVPELDEVTDRLVVFVHGLAETTASWRWWSEADDGTPVPSYGARLADAGWTPLELAYNTGLPVATSGRDLAELLDRLERGWPVPLREVALVGHSMGGLVVGVACQDGLHDGAPWVDRLSHVVTLGTPHRGSWLAQLAHRGAASFRRRPETAPLADILDLRSPGIRDLTRGWRPDPAAPGPSTHPTAAPAVPAGDTGEDGEPTDEAAAVAEVRTLARMLPHAQHTYVSSALGRSDRHVLARVLGDGLVHPRSSTSPARDGGPNVRIRHHVGVGHIRLVHHPAVADDLVAWLGPRADAAAPRAP